MFDSWGLGTELPNRRATLASRAERAERAVRSVSTADEAHGFRVRSERQVPANETRARNSERTRLLRSPSQIDEEVEAALSRLQRARGVQMQDSARRREQHTTTGERDTSIETREWEVLHVELERTA